MAEVVQDTQQEFWRSPTVLEPAVEAPLPAAVQEMAEACAACGTEFMIGARFCHTCGLRRPIAAAAGTACPERSRRDAAEIAGRWTRSVAVVRASAGSIWAGSIGAASRQAASLASSWRKTSLPHWVQYLHFHEIKRWIGLPTAPLIAFMIGLGCVAGAIGVSLFYKASNLAEFQAIQMWRIEWLLAATASFVAGILLKKPDSD